MSFSVGFDVVVVVVVVVGGGEMCVCMQLKEYYQKRLVIISRDLKQLLAFTIKGSTFVPEQVCVF